MNNQEKIATLMFRYTRKELTGEEKKELTAWRRAHPEKKEFFINNTDPESIMLDVGAFLASKEKSLQNLKDCYPDIWKDSPARRHNRGYWLFAMAAIALNVFSLGLFILAR